MGLTSECMCIFRFGFGIYFNHQRESGGQKMNVSERIKICQLIIEMKKHRELAEKNGLIDTSVIDKLPGAVETREETK